MKIDELTKQVTLLGKHHIGTDEQLFSYQHSVEEQIKTVTADRTHLRNEIRKVNITDAELSQAKSSSLRMPPFISPESVKELNEVMCVTKDNWTPIPMYCSNCGALLYGYRNDEGKIKYECKRCGTVAVRVQKGRRHDKIDLYAPEGQIRYY